ncbi:hypothetical protein [Geomonas edaphica]|uniref:hypothetical protein n=1 Tax=Geomonas edaphica TaxID=2570226 RepID=UPI0010A92528|nr:hypothetical protein [Geomonas edaphica]
MSEGMLRRGFAVTFLAAFLFTCTGCSALMKWGYLAPSEGDKWAKSNSSASRNRPPAYTYPCEAITVEALSEVIYDYTYSVGPLFLPIFPIFNLGGNDKLREEFSIWLWLYPKETAKTKVLSSKNISLNIRTNTDIFKPIDVMTYENSSKYLFVKAKFRFDLNDISGFTLNFDTLLDGCTIAPLQFQKIFKTTWEAFP